MNARESTGLAPERDVEEGTRKVQAKKARLKRPAAHFVRRHKTALAVVFIVLLAGSMGAAIIFNPAQGGTLAPDFSIKNVHDGSTFRLSEQRGKPIIIDFMSITCEPCTDTIKGPLKDIDSKYKDNIVILSIDIQHSDKDEDLKEHMESLGAYWPSGVDRNSIWEEYVDKGYVPSEPYPGTPTILILDQNGVLVWSHRGEPDTAELDVAVSNVLAGQAEPLTVIHQNILVLSYLLGLLMFFAPCALPLLPGYMGYYMAKHGEKGTVFTSVKNGLIAALGIFVTYLAVGGLASLMGAAAGNIILSLVPFIGALLVLLGILMFFHIQIPTQWFSEGIGRLKGAILRKRGGAATETAQAAPREKGLFSYGMVYGTASMGCSMPVFIGVIAVALMYGPVYAFMALVMFGLGMATLMVVVTVIVGLAKRTIVQHFVGAIGIMNRISALLLVGVGLYLIMESMGVF